MLKKPISIDMFKYLFNSKALACGDVGQGAMCDWKHIANIIQERLALL
jgi:hypothetical protein